MIKFFSGLFGQPQTFRDVWLPLLEAEGIILQMEEVPTAVTYRNFTSPQKCCSWNRRYGYRTSLVLTQHRFAIFENARKIVNLPWCSEYWNEVSVGVKDENTLSVIANVTAFPNQLSGEVELWLNSPLAQAVCDEVTSWRGRSARVSRILDVAS